MSNVSRRSFFGLMGAGLVVAAVGVDAARAEVVVYERAAPPLRVERVPPPPHAGFVWVPGHWVWRGRWVWVRGHHVRRGRPLPPPVAEVVTPRPSPRHFWIPGHWEWNDRRADWVWIRGHWVR
jgi:hypothetical protein